MKLFTVFLLSLFLVGCGSDEVVVEKRADVSYAELTPAAGMTYREFRESHEFGEGDMHMAQKRFLMLDRNNNGSLSQDELGY
jgi:Ca2+-binding EF-hand superfamily protein